MSEQLKVYVANLGKYNEGILQGEWLALPKTAEEINQFLKEKVGLELDPQAAFEAGMRGESVYEEYAIHDAEVGTQLAKTGLEIHEYTSLKTLNTVATLAECVDTEAFDIIQAYCDAVDSCSIEDLASLLAHFAQDEEPEGVLNYEFYIDRAASKEEAFGLFCVDELNPDLANQLNDLDIERFFDYESYGQEQADGGFLANGYFIDGQSNIADWTIDLSMDEVQEIANELSDSTPSFSELAETCKAASEMQHGEVTKHKSPIER